MHRTENAAGGITTTDKEEVRKPFSLFDKVGENVKVTFKGVQKDFDDKNDVSGILEEHAGVFFIKGRRLPESIIRNIQNIT